MGWGNALAALNSSPWDDLPGPRHDPWLGFATEKDFESALADVLGHSGWRVYSQIYCDHKAIGSGKVKALRPDLYIERRRTTDAWPETICTIAIECKLDGGEVEAFNQCEAYQSAFNWRRKKGERREGQLRRPDIVVMGTVSSDVGLHRPDRYPGLKRAAWARGLSVLDLGKDRVSFRLGDDRPPVLLAVRP